MFEKNGVWGWEKYSWDTHSNLNNCILAYFILFLFLFMIYYLGWADNQEEKYLGDAPSNPRNYILAYVFISIFVYDLLPRLSCQPREKYWSTPFRILTIAF